MNWREAEAEVKRIAGDLPVYWGTGYPIRHPHVIATKKDALSREGYGYNIYIFPQGDYYLAPVTVKSVWVD